MKLSVLVLINALAVALSLALLNFYFQHNWLYMLATLVVALGTSFVVFYYLTERFVYSKIKLIYKLIHNLKLGKDLKDAIGEYVSDDPIFDVEQESMLIFIRRSVLLEILNRRILAYIDPKSLLRLNFKHQCLLEDFS